MDSEFLAMHVATTYSSLCTLKVRVARRAAAVARAFVVTAAVVVYWLGAIHTMGGGRVVGAEPPASRNELPLSEFAVRRDGGPLVVPVRANGKRFRMVVDTGAAVTAFGAAHRAMLGMSTHKEEMSLDGFTKTIEYFPGPVIEVGFLRVMPHEVACFDSPIYQGFAVTYREHFDGILGMDVLSACAIGIDFDAGKLWLCTRADSSFGRAVRMRFDFGNDPVGPFVRADLGGGHAQDFLLDTGCAIGISGGLEPRTFRRLSRERSLASAAPAFNPHYFLRSVGAGGELRMALGRVGSLSLAGYTHTGLVFGEFPVNALGLGYLSRYCVVLDFPEQVMYLRPLRRFMPHTGTFLARRRFGDHNPRGRSDRGQHPGGGATGGAATS